jgi:hypothetical protein
MKIRKSLHRVVVPPNSVGQWLGLVLIKKRLMTVNSFPVIRGFAVRVTPISTNKKHATNTLKMAALLRSNVMQS